MIGSSKTYVSQQKITEVYLDGASRGNPGESGIGILIITADDNREEIKEYIGKNTNNEAEYKALVKALGCLAERKISSAKIHTDSQLIANQINGLWKIKNPKLAKLNQKAKNLLSIFSSLEIKHIPRKQNLEADKLANQAIDGYKEAVKVDSILKPQENLLYKPTVEPLLTDIPQQKITEVYLDGASRGNPGESGIGILIITADGSREEIKEYIGKNTNNEAEYKALVKALGCLAERKISSAKIYTDSQLIANQINGLWKIKNPRLAKLNQKAKNLLSIFSSLEIKHIPREQNLEADRLANQAIDRYFNN